MVEVANARVQLGLELGQQPGLVGRALLLLGVLVGLLKSIPGSTLQTVITALDRLREQRGLGGPYELN